MNQQDASKLSPERILGAVREMLGTLEDGVKAKARGTAAPDASLKILLPAFLAVPDYEEAVAETEDLLGVASAELGRCNVLLNEVYSANFRSQLAAAIAPEPTHSGKQLDDRLGRFVDELSTLLEEMRDQIDLISSTMGIHQGFWGRMDPNERRTLRQIFSRQSRGARFPALGADGRKGSDSEGGRA